MKSGHGDQRARRRAAQASNLLGEARRSVEQFFASAVRAHRAARCRRLRFSSARDYWLTYRIFRMLLIWFRRCSFCWNSLFQSYSPLRDDAGGTVGAVAQPPGGGVAQPWPGDV